MIALEQSLECRLWLKEPGCLQPQMKNVSLQLSLRSVGNEPSPPQHCAAAAAYESDEGI